MVDKSCNSECLTTGGTRFIWNKYIYACCECLCSSFRMVMSKKHIAYISNTNKHHENYIKTVLNFTWDIDKRKYSRTFFYWPTATKRKRYIITKPPSDKLPQRWESTTTEVLETWRKLTQKWLRSLPKSFSCHCLRGCLSRSNAS